LEWDFIEVRVGYLHIMKLPVLSLTILHGGLIGDETEANATRMCEVLLQSRAALKADCLKFSHINTENTLFKIITRRLSKLNVSHWPRFQKHWKTEMPGSFNAFMASLSSHHRKQIRRTIRNLETASSNVSVRLYTKTEELPVLYEDVETIAAKTYQRQLGAGFCDDEQCRQRVQLEAEKGWLRMFVLYVDGIPTAYWWGQGYRGCFFSNALGYDPVYAKYSPGTYLIVKAIERLCDERYRFIDFGLGDALYKRQFGNLSHQESTVYLFPASGKGYGLNCIVSATNAIDGCLRCVARRLGILEKVKSLWRLRLRTGGR
jgi:hypothetical protein